MTPLVQVGVATLMIALSYTIILAASTASFILMDRRWELFPRKEVSTETEGEEHDQDLP